MSINKRSAVDKLISRFLSLWYNASEPVILSILRLRMKGFYKKNYEPLISVYTPTYNRGDILIDRALKSVLSQTYKNFEYIIIGDHCTDNTAQLIQDVGDPRIIFYNIPKRGYRYPPTAENHWLAGPVVAANTALKMINGSWIARIDDDDIWSDDHLEVLLKYAQAGDYEFVSSAYEAERDGVRYVVDVMDETPRIGGTQTWLYRSYLKFMKYNIQCWRKEWNRVNDTDLQERIGKAGVKTGFLDKVTCYILPRPGETEIGLKAYITNEKEKEVHYKFKD